MKGLLSWFKSNTKLKRWILLVLIGIILSCYGFSQILVSDEMRFIDVGKIVITFVIGFTAVILGLVFMQKRTLEILIEADAKQNDSIDIKSLIYDKNIYEKGPNIVVIGGGSGINAVLEGIKKYSSNITAIVTVADYGLNASKSRKQLNLLPTNDIKESIVALSKDEVVMEHLLNYKFTTDRLKELAFGDIYISAMEGVYGNFVESIESACKVLNITGRVLPATLDSINICAELTDGTIIEEKSKIPEVVSEKIAKIQRIYVTPSNCKPAPGVLEAIQKADAIIIGPGSLYTNVIPNLLIKGVAKQIKESEAIKVYISNIMTEPGQTDNYSITDHIDAITDHVGAGIIDFCICDTGEVTPEFIRRYNLNGSDLVDQDIQKATSRGIKIIKKDLSKIKGEYIRHNPDTLAATIIELICNDLRFKDKQGDTQYLLLNTKLKDDKKRERHKDKVKKVIKKAKKKHENERISENRKKSKFQEKYHERINAIQESDKEKIKNASKKNK